MQLPSTVKSSIRPSLHDFPFESVLLLQHARWPSSPQSVDSAHQETARPSQSGALAAPQVGTLISLRLPLQAESPQRQHRCPVKQSHALSFLPPQCVARAVDALMANPANAAAAQERSFRHEPLEVFTSLLTVGSIVPGACKLLVVLVDLAFIFPSPHVVQ